MKCSNPDCNRDIGLVGGAQVGLICYSLFGSGATPIRFYMGGLHDVAREANFEAKELGESRNVGSRRGIVASRRRIRGSRWSGKRYADEKHGAGNCSR
jgi:hypothetical protein